MTECFDSKLEALDIKPNSQLPSTGLFLESTGNQGIQAGEQSDINGVKDTEYENVAAEATNGDDSDDDLQIVEVVKIVKPTIRQVGAKITLEEICQNAKIIAARNSDVRKEWQVSTVTSRIILSPNGAWYNSKFRVLFEDGTSRYAGPTELAYIKPAEHQYAIGMRVVTYYPIVPSDPESARILFSGVVGERPRPTNGYRYLILFDNGTAIHSKPEETMIIFQMPEELQSKSLSHLKAVPLHQLYMKSYLEDCPDVPNLRMHEGEFVDLFYPDIGSSSIRKAKVVKVDHKTALVRFLQETKYEWVFRGSWRFQSIYNSHSVKTRWLKYQQEQSNDGSSTDYLSDIRMINHGTKRMNPRQYSTASRHGNIRSAPVIEYDGPEEVEEKIVDPGSLRPEEPLPAGAIQDLAHLQAYDPLTAGKQSSERKNTARKGTGASIARLAAPHSKEPINLQPKIDIIYTPRGTFIPHDHCTNACLGDVDELADWRGINYFVVPIRVGWERNIIQQPIKSMVTYRTPCLRRLRNISELAKYLSDTRSLLDVDMFSFDPNLRLWPEEQDNIANPHYYLPDLSKGSEPQPISVLNERTSEPMDKNFIYRADRYPHRKHQETICRATDRDFLACCSCTDNCADPNKCECQAKLTRETCEQNNDPLYDKPAYQFKRLLDHRVGIFECNPRCPCNSRCSNRVVQNGIRARLQVFRTKKKGWGVRTLHDIPKGSFLCVYTAQMLDNDVAEIEGAQFGDAYLADLDFIEIYETNKSDYESDVEYSDDDLVENSKRVKDDDSSESDYKYPQESSDSEYDGYEARRKKNSQNIPAWSKPTPPCTQPDSDDSVICLDSDDNKPPLNQSAQKLVTISIPDGEGGLKQVKLQSDTMQTLINPAAADSPKTNESVNDSDSNNASEGNARSLRNRQKAISYKEPKLDDTFDNYPQSRSPAPLVNGDKAERKRKHGKPTKAGRSTNGPSRDENKGVRIRKYYGETSTYVLDARMCGNIGRFMNHSCDPNSFVQNVFVDTHDLRFPWVSFFAGRDIKAYEELTWDYNYVVDSVEGRKLWCYCEASNCRKRLL